MESGKVKLVDRAKGYGFILPDDGGEDVFIPPGEVKRCGLELRDGDAVAFDKEANERRPGAFIARNLRLPLPEFLR